MVRHPEASDAAVSRRMRRTGRRDTSAEADELALGPLSCLTMDAPSASSALARRRMQDQPRRDTTPELALRRELWRRGLRGYRLDWRVPGLRRRTDLAWPGRRLAVFVDGCYWHQCPDHGRLPTANRTWWREKLARNVRRDRDTDERLRAAGWTVVRVWEHEDPTKAADRVAAAHTAVN